MVSAKSTTLEELDFSFSCAKKSRTTMNQKHTQVVLCKSSRVINFYLLYTFLIYNFQANLLLKIITSLNQPADS